MSTEESKKLVAGDDAVESFEEDWLGFTPHAKDLTEKLYEISKSSSVCCGLIGGWGSGKTSFMRLMVRQIEERCEEWNAVSVWLVAWDPGGVPEIGDAILYRIFQAVVEDAEKQSKDDAEELKKHFNKLKRALGLRKGIKERIKGFLGTVAETSLVPSDIQDVAKIANYVVGEFQSSHDVRDSFMELKRYLEKNCQTLFLFIDDLDRASGEQILSLLSEMKVYLSHRHIVIVLGFDEEYVVKSLSEVLPQEINAKRYVEKIISVRRNIPAPNVEDLRELASNLLKALSPSIEESIPQIANYAAILCAWSPRKLKRLILSFIQYLPPNAILHTDRLLSLIIITAADEAGIIKDRTVQEVFRRGNEPDIISTLERIAEEESKKLEISQIIRTVSMIQPSFTPHTTTLSGFPSPDIIYGDSPGFERKESKEGVFNWRNSLLPILKSSAETGFDVPREVFFPMEGLEISKSKIESISEEWANLININVNELYLMLSSEDEYIVVILTSHQNFPPDYTGELVVTLLNNCAFIAAEKPFLIWIIDDANHFVLGEIENLYRRAKLLSRGLKNRIELRYMSQITRYKIFYLSYWMSSVLIDK